MRKLSNKALVVLNILRQHGGELDCQSVAAAVRGMTPCGTCGGSGDDGDPDFGCRGCFGRGDVLFYYSDAYVCLRQLMNRGLVTRRHRVDEFGDDLPGLLWSATDKVEEMDELEALFAAPAAEK